MKKFFRIILILLFVFIMIGAVPKETNIYSQGVYSLDNLRHSGSSNIYSVQNISTKNSSYVAIFTDDFRAIQVLYLETSSNKYNLVPLKPDYKIVILGTGEVYIS